MLERQFSLKKGTSRFIRDNSVYQTRKITEPRTQTSRTQVLKLAAIALALGRKDPYTEGHARRVAQYAGRLATRMGLPTQEIENIWLGGLLHDIGKIGLSERVFRNTEAELPEDLLAEVRRHPLIGMNILRDLHFPAPILDNVHYHHERIDGSGYPIGLRGDDIPQGAKIISVADCFDAITTDRSYQKGKSTAEALTILHQMGGRCLCARLVKAFTIEILEGGMIEAHPGENLPPKNETVTRF